jgi:hypothetical protein
VKAKIICILVMTLLVITAINAVGTTNKEEKTKLSNSFYLSSEVHGDYKNPNPASVVLWDNGMHYHGAVVSQYDENHYTLNAIGADDFQFEETTVITDVHWMGYLVGLEDFYFDWNISFYMDRGDGNAPGDKIYEQFFLNATVHKTFVEELWNGRMFSYWVDLPDEITFIGGEKYWISIQAIGWYFGHIHWGCHAPVVQHVLVWKSIVDGYLNWTDCTELWQGNALDFCFQLTGDGNPVIPNLACDGDLQWDEVPTGSTVNGSIIIYNNGDVGSMLQWEVQDVPDWGTDWSLDWWGDDFYCSTDEGYVGTTSPEEIIVEVKAPNDPNTEFTGEIILVNSDDPADTCSINVMLTTPRSKTIYNSFLNWLQCHPNLFPFLQKLLQ